MADVSAALLTEGDQECIGFTIHCVSAFAAHHPADDALPRALRDVVQRLGEQPLPVLLREAGALVQRHLIDTALRNSGGDEAEAAAQLGISRNSLAQRRRSPSHSNAGPSTG
jgi:DNA-binding NtrC family response regulator